MTDSPLPAQNVIHALPSLKMVIGAVELSASGYTSAEAAELLSFLIEKLRVEHDLFSAEQAKQNYHG